MVRDIVRRLVFYAVTRVPRDVYNALRRALVEETSDIARTCLEFMVKNIEYAMRNKIPVCQDTGVLYFDLVVGEDFPVKSKLKNIIYDVVRELTLEGLLRPNAVHPFTNVNSGDNTGRFVPWIDYSLVEGSDLKVSVIVRGGGSEFVAKLYTIPPVKGLNAVRKAVLEAIIDAGPKPCPPVIVGVGIGATASIALKLAQKALFRKIGVRHPDKRVAEFEENLLLNINKLGIGVHGFGGKTTALDVKVEYSHRHVALYSVGVVLSCWALRRASAIIHGDGKVEYDGDEVWD